MTFFRPRRRGCLSSLMSPLSSSTLEEGLTRETSVSLILYHGNSTLINLFDSNSTVECVRSCDQKLYLHNETKGRFCIKIEFNPQKNISLLQHGRCFFVYSTNVTAVTSCEHTLLPSLWEGGEKRVYLFFNRVALPLYALNLFRLQLSCHFTARMPIWTPSDVNLGCLKQITRTSSEMPSAWDIPCYLTGTPCSTTPLTQEHQS